LWTSKALRRFDVKRTIILAVLLLAGAAPSYAQTCLHGSNEQPEQKVRRNAALQLATRINLAESNVIGPLPRKYRPLNELGNLPPIPAGFDLQFHTDGQTYTFSIKDRMDPCHYVVFSDQDGTLYEAIARTGPAIIVPLGTK